MPFLEWKKKLCHQIEDRLVEPYRSLLTQDVLVEDLNISTKAEVADLAYPCFRLAKTLKKSPGHIALELKQMIEPLDNVRVSAEGAYLNFKWDPADIFSSLWKRLASRQVIIPGITPSTLIIEYGSPNIAKPLGFHHIRTFLIGNILSNIAEVLGHRVERVNFIGDWGAQFAKLLYAIRQWNDNGQKLEMSKLLEWYVAYHERMDSDPEFAQTAEKESRELLRRLEMKSPDLISLWKEVRQVSVDTMNKTLERLRIRFDRVEAESDVSDTIDKLLEDIKRKSQAVLSDGAWIVECEGVSPPPLIQKSDGTSLYLTRDIGTAMSRYERTQFDKMLYVVSLQQTLHFKQLFAVLHKMGYDWAKKCQHVPYGIILLGSTKMSTRKGNLVFLDDFLNEAAYRAREICLEKNPALQQMDRVSETIGLSGVVFGILSTHRERDIHFEWEKMLSLDGDTGPYVQYAYVRSRSLLGKHSETTKIPDKTWNPQSTDNYCFLEPEASLLLTLSQYELAVTLSEEKRDPFFLAHYLIQCAKAFNRFYYECPVIQSEGVAKQIRLALVSFTEATLGHGLNLMGLTPLSAM